LLLFFVRFKHIYIIVIVNITQEMSGRID